MAGGGVKLGTMRGAGAPATARRPPPGEYREPWDDRCPPVMFFVILAFQGTVMFLLLRHFGIITFI
jgi:hypothetical protein